MALDPIVTSAGEYHTPTRGVSGCIGSNAITSTGLALTIPAAWYGRLINVEVIGADANIAFSESSTVAFTADSSLSPSAPNTTIGEGVFAGARNEFAVPRRPGDTTPIYLWVASRGGTIVAKVSLAGTAP